MIDCVAEGNGGAGLAVAPNTPLELIRFQAINNKGPGIDLSSPKHHNASSKVARDILSGTVATVAGEYIKNKLKIK
jgi:hypothetical protein